MKYLIFLTLSICLLSGCASTNSLFKSTSKNSESELFDILDRLNSFESDSLTSNQDSLVSLIREKVILLELHKIEKSEIEKDNEKITKNYRQTDAGELVKAKEKELQQTTFEETVQQFSLDTTATSTNLSKEAKAAIKSYIEQVSELNKELEKSDLKTITFGVSFGAKWWEDQIYDYAINPIDSTLISDELEKTALNFATNIAFTPFLHSDMINHRIEKWRNKNFLKTIGYQALRNLSFVVTIDVARISDDESSFEFLESVDGAIGLGYRLGKNFFVAYTWDWQKVRQLRSDFNQNKTQLLDLNGQIVTEIDLNNDTLFRDRVIRKNGVLFIWSF